MKTGRLLDERARQALFAPRSIAIIGASSDPAKTASRPLRYLLDGGFKGHIYPVNPRSPDILGVKCWPSVTDIPETPDLAYILLPDDAAIAALGECAARGIPAAMVLASGFGETGPQGRDREEQLAKIVESTGIRLIGPSCLGIANLHENIVLTGNAAFAEVGGMAGGIFCASQSGSMIGALLSRGAAKGLNFGGLVSVGNELDIDIGTICEAKLDDPRITSFMLFLETIRDPVSFRRFAAGAAMRNKPVAALKLGRSAAAAELAESHTGALAGEDDVADAFLSDCGVARVETLEGLLESDLLLRRSRISAQRRAAPVVGVLTTTGGGAALVVDQLAIRGIAVEGPDEETLAVIRETGLDIASGRIVDLTLAGVRYDIVRTAMEAMLASPKFDLVLVVIGSSARFQPELAVKPIIDVGVDNDRLAAFLVPEAPQALSRLVASGVPAFRTPEACADVISAALHRREARALVLAPQDTAAPTRPMNELAGYDILRTLGVPSAPSIRVPVDGEVDGPIRYPVAVKVLHEQIAHKSDVGGIVLGVESSQEVRAAGNQIRTRLAAARPDLEIRDLVVQEMVSGAVGEMLLSYRIDPNAGPVVMLACGGVATEVLRDRSIRMAPVDRAEALEMIAELKAYPLFTGFRGRPAGDLDALAGAISSLSRLAERPELGIRELEINPLMIMPQGEGVVAVDILARTSARGDLTP